MSESSLTLADCRQNLSGIVSDEDFVSTLNQACERLVNSGKWKGNIVKTSFASNPGYITLPPTYMSVLAGVYNHCPIPTFSQWHQYVESGPGFCEETDHWRGSLQDMGDSFCTQLNIDTANFGEIEVFSASPDNDLVVRLFGLDENGERIFDGDGVEGEEVTLTSPSILTTRQYTVITGFQKPKSRSTVRLVVNGSASSYQIAEYLPSETRPRYRRYLCGEQQTDEVQAIQVLCQRKFFPVYAETDWVHPGNLGALKNGLLSIFYENNQEPERAEYHFARALRLLDDESRAYRGGAKIPPQFFPGGYPVRNTSTH